MHVNKLSERSDAPESVNNRFINQYVLIGEMSGFIFYWNWERPGNQYRVHPTHR